MKSKRALSTKKRLNLAVVFLILGIIIFIAAYVGMKQQIGLGKLNQPVLAWMINHRSENVTGMAKIITSIANPYVFASVVGLIVIVWAIIKHEIWRPILLAGSVAVAAGTSTLLKIIFMDARPPQIDMIPTFE